MLHQMLFENWVLASFKSAQFSFCPKFIIPED
nr:MAG TPA: hypothetical protein [Caudoviricetes sp.]